MTPTQAIVWAQGYDREPEELTIYHAALVLAAEVKRLTVYPRDTRNGEWPTPGQTILTWSHHVWVSRKHNPEMYSDWFFWMPAPCAPEEEV